MKRSSIYVHRCSRCHFQYCWARPELRLTLRVIGCRAIRGTVPRYLSDRLHYIVAGDIDNNDAVFI